jgi:hypothetical protein
MSELKRYFSQDKFKNFLEDFDFLFKKIKESLDELDIKLRSNYFNLYYKGNSLAKVCFEGENYKVAIHNKFIENVFDGDKRFNPKKSEGTPYVSYILEPKLLPAFFQTKHLKRIYSNIREVNYGEEIAFEQILITDNLNRQNFFIIDRQITETSLKRKRLDLLALKQVDKNKNKYHFLVIEIKLGNNPELKKDVGEQLEGYLTHIQGNFPSWKKCYEENYRQIKKTGIFDIPEYPEIEIVNSTQGVVVVGGYFNIAQKSIKQLENLYPDIKVEHMRQLLCN